MAMRPKIAILNSSSFGKHHPDQIARLEAFAELKRVTVPPDVSAQVLTQALGNVDGIIASVTPKITRDTLSELSNLRLLARHGIGCDNVDLVAATELGIPVSRVKGILERDAVAELAVSLIMATARFIPQGFLAVRESRWEDRSKFIGIELRGKRVGLIGLGNIGSRVAEIMGLGFNSEIVAYDPHIDPAEVKIATLVGLEELLTTSDVISFHCPLTAETKRILNADRFKLIKRGARLINTCRGELLDESTLVEALKSGALTSYGTDVVEGEPIDGSHRLAQLPNALILPHLGGYSHESLRGMGETMVTDCENVFLKGEAPGQLANPEVTSKEYRKWL